MFFRPLSPSASSFALPTTMFFVVLLTDSVVVVDSFLRTDYYRVDIMLLSVSPQGVEDVFFWLEDPKAPCAQLLLQRVRNSGCTVAARVSSGLPGQGPLLDIFAHFFPRNPVIFAPVSALYPVNDTSGARITGC